MASAELDRILESHLLDPAALRSNDFGRSLALRFEALLRLIEAAMGKPAIRDSQKAEHPFVVSQRPTDPDEVLRLIEARESQRVEFKQSARADTKTGARVDYLIAPILKGVAAFLNTDGGDLLVGVRDDGVPTGIEIDLPHVHHNNLDGYELFLRDVLHTNLESRAHPQVQIGFVELDGKTVCRIHAIRSSAPTFVTINGKKVFLKRDGPKCQPLEGAALADYLQSRFS